MEPCPDGFVENSVGLSLAYQVGPDNKAMWEDCATREPGGIGESRAGRYPCGEPYYGLYKITVYPFIAAGYIPMVYQNGQYVQCYFDSSGDAENGESSLMGTLDADPGWELANACAEMNQASTGRHGMAGWATRRGGSWSSIEPMGVVSVKDRAALKEEYELGLSEFGVPVGSRRAVSGISWADTQIEVRQQFQPPDTKHLKFWVVGGPVLCFFAGLFCAIIHACWDFYEHKQDMRIHVSAGPSLHAPASARA